MAWWRGGWVLALGWCIGVPAWASADQNCWNSDRTFYDCTANNGAVGVSAPIVGNTLENNPANLPTEPSPLGLELIASDRSAPLGRARLGFSTVKGFDGLGFGVGSWSQGTFGAPDFPEHFANTAGEDAFREYQLRDKSVLSLRLGTTVLLPRLGLPRFVRFSVGASLGLGQVSGEVSPQVGLVMRVGPLGLGYSESFDHLAVDLPRTRVSQLSAGIFLGRIYLAFSHSTLRSELNRTSSNTASLRIPLGFWVVHGGAKFQKNAEGGPDTWARAGLLRKLNRRFNLGYEHGYYRYSHSLLVQVFL